MRTYVRTTIAAITATIALGLGAMVAASAQTLPRQTPPSQSTTYATAAATALQTSRLYIDPAIAASSGLNGTDAAAIASELASSSPPIYIVVEPEAAVPNVKNGYDVFPKMVGQISSTLGVAKGTVGAIFPTPPHHFRASSAVISSSNSSSLANDLAKQSADAKGKIGMRAMIEDFISRVRAASQKSDQGGGSARGVVSGPISQSHSGLWIFLSILGLIIAGTVGIFIYLSRRASHDIADEVDADRSRILADYDSLGTDLVTHSDDLGSHSNSNVVDSYQAANTAYGNAGGLLEGATTLRKIQVVADVISSGQEAMERARRAARGEVAGNPTTVDPMTTEGVTNMYDKRPTAQPIRRKKGHAAPAAGTTRVINNTTTFYYPGGTHMGIWYGPGYYGGMDPWLSYMVAEELFEDHNEEREEDERGENDDRGDRDDTGGDYDQGGQQTGSYDQGRDDSYDQGSSTPESYEPVSTPDLGSDNYDTGGSVDTGSSDLGGGSGDW